MKCSDGSIQQRILGSAIVKTEQIKYDISVDPQVIQPLLDVLDLKCVAVSALFKMFLVDEMGLVRVRRDTRLLNILYGLCRFYNILGGVPVIQAEVNAIPRKLLEDKQWGEPLVREFHQAFPEAVGEINKLSLARAAGYVTKFRKVIGWELDGNANGDPKRPRLLHPKKDDLDTWARGYKHLGKGPAWMTQARLDAHEHPPIINSFTDIEKLKALSPIFAAIPDTRPPTIRQGRKDYQNPHGRIEDMPENPELRAMADDDEEEIYLGPIIYTKHWFPVLQRFFKTDNIKDIPALPRENVMPNWGDGDLMSGGSLDRTKKYEAYVKKRKKFGRNALVVYLLSELKRSVGKQREFKSISSKIDVCLE